MGLREGDEVAFLIEDDRVVLVPVKKEIEAAFGLVKATRSVSLDDMDRAIRAQAGTLGTSRRGVHQQGEQVAACVAFGKRAPPGVDIVTLLCVVYLCRTWSTAILVMRERRP